MAMTNFRRSSMVNSKKKSGGGGGNWFDKITLPKANPTPFMLINAEYIDPNPDPNLVEKGPDGHPLPVKNSFYKFKSHRKKTMKNGRDWFADEPCSLGYDPHNPQPCAGCTAMDLGDKTVTIQDKFVFGLVHLSPYHRHPLFDKEGKVRTKQDGTAIYTYSECEGRTCNFCRILQGLQPVNAPGAKYAFPNYNPADIKTEFAHRRYLEVGKNHLGNLGGWDSVVTSQCSTPLLDANGNFIARCSQQLIRDGFVCPHCGSEVIDLSTDPRKDEEIDKAVAQAYPCLKCQKGVLLNEVVSCDACAGRNMKHTQLGMFDVVLWGKREGEGTGSQLMLQQFQSLDEFARTLPPHIKQMLNGKTVQDIVKELGSPYDFDKIFHPRNWEDQCKMLELNVAPPHQQNAYSQPQQNPQYANYPAAGPAAPQGGMSYVPQAQQPGPQGFPQTMKPNFSK